MTINVKCPDKVHMGVLAMFRMKPFKDIPASLKRKKVVLTRALADALNLDRSTTLGRFIKEAIKYQEPLIACWKHVPSRKDPKSAHGRDYANIRVLPRFANPLGLRQHITTEDLQSRLHSLQKRSHERYLDESPYMAYLKARFRANYESVIGSLMTAFFAFAVSCPPPVETSSDSLTRYAIGGSMFIASSLFSVNALFNKFVNIPKSRDFYFWLSGISNKGHYGK